MKKRNRRGFIFATIISSSLIGTSALATPLVPAASSEPSQSQSISVPLPTPSPSNHPSTDRTGRNSGVLDGPVLTIQQQLDDLEKSDLPQEKKDIMRAKLNNNAMILRV